MDLVKYAKAHNGGNFWVIVEFNEGLKASYRHMPRTVEGFSQTVIGPFGIRATEQDGR